jgi:hypothetical protein
MNSKPPDRVVFYSKDDMTVSHHLTKAEELLNNIDISNLTDINDLLELQHVRQYFEEELFLLTWDEVIKDNFIEKIKLGTTQLRQFFLSVNDYNLADFAEAVEFTYRAVFWKSFSFYKVFERISKISFAQILENNPHHIRDVLSNFPIVTYYDSEIRLFMLMYDKSAELLLAKFEEGGRSKEVTYVFPKSLSLSDKENIISNYLDQKDANLNYIRLIEHSKNSKDLTISARIRLKAKKRSTELNNKILDQGNAVNFGIQITLDKDQTEPCKVSNNDKVLEISYSEALLDQLTNDVARFLVFKKLFGFTDEHGLIPLVSKKSELDVMETLFMKSKNEYPDGLKFHRKDQLAIVQLFIFEHYLNRNTKSIEQIIQSFITDGLNGHFKLNNLLLRFPSKQSTFLEKIRALAPELECILKQYQAFATDGQIDFEIIEIDSTPITFNEIKSVLEKKYVYIRGDKANIVRHHFYSDQSLLHYIESFKNKYSNLYDLLHDEDVGLNQFQNYQQPLINYLIAEGYLHIDDNGHVKMKKDIELYLLGDLHRNEVISYWHFPAEVRDVIDEMEEDGLVQVDNTLFSKQESDYFNYYLNKKGFTNGLNIRNKYLHGSNSGSDKEHKNEYYILLRLVILVLLKITDDLALKNSNK